MANTTLNQLTSIVGTGVDSLDSFLLYDVSANTEKQITMGELKNAIGNGVFTFTTSGTSDAIVVTSTDSSATAAPDIIFYRNSASPAASDSTGNIVFRGKNSVAAVKDYAVIGSNITSPTSAAEGGNITVSTMYNGTFAERVRFRDNGSVSIGGSGLVQSSLTIGKAITGATAAYGIRQAAEIQSDVTDTTYIYQSNPSVANTAFTLTHLRHYSAWQGTVGQLAAVTNQYGFFNNSGNYGATNNYGVYIQGVATTNVTTGKNVYGIYSAHGIATGGGNSWNFYANGTAPNYFNGSVGIGTTTPACKLQVSGQIAGGYTALANGTAAMALGTNAVVKVTPTATATLTTTVAPAGARASVIILTSGTTSYTLTFGTGFLTTGTLATGTVTGKTFVINFVSDGTTMIETGRTAAM